MKNSDINDPGSATVAINSYIPANSYTADLLGRERSGQGVLLADTGILMTIGYLITEAESIWVTDQGGMTVEAYIVANDYESGLALIKTLSPVDVKPVRPASLGGLGPGSDVLIASRGEVTDATILRIGEFAGRWEYLLDNAIYTAPPVNDWAGSALFTRDGYLRGIGCLLVHNLGDEGVFPESYNMYVPVAEILPELDRLISCGARLSAPSPWLGMLVQEESEGLVVTGVYTACPAELAGVRLGDVIVECAGSPVSSLSELFRAIRRIGSAGVEVALTLLRMDETIPVKVISADRESYFRRGPWN